MFNLKTLRFSSLNHVNSNRTLDFKNGINYPVSIKILKAGGGDSNLNLFKESILRNEKYKVCLEQC